MLRRLLPVCTLTCLLLACGDLQLFEPNIIVMGGKPQPNPTPTPTPEPGPPPNPEDCTNLTYVGKIQSVFKERSCNAGCHSNTTPPLTLGTYSDVVAAKDRIVESLTEHCKEDKNATDCMIPFADADTQVILDWIQKCSAKEE